jgi:MFS family permease
VVLGWKMLPRSKLGSAGRLDYTGLALLATSMPLIVYGLSEIGTKGSFTAPTVVWPTLVGLALSAVFVWHALRTERPLLDVRLYANRVFGAASLTTFGLGAALFGAMILVPLYYQNVRGASVIETGLLNGPQGLGALIAMPIAGRLTERFGGGRIAIVGVTTLCLSTLPLAFVGANTSEVLISFVLVLRGLSIGFSFMPAMTAAFAVLKPEQLSDATPQLNVVMRLGSAVGVAVLAVVLQRASVHAHSHEALAHAFAHTYWWGLGIAVLSLIPCLLLLKAEQPGATRAQAAAEEEQILRAESAIEAGI